LIVGQWLMLLALSSITGGAMGLLFEKMLLLMLKPVLPVALRRQRLAVAVGDRRDG
jgi:putative ABC transport system permease protein